uniref:Protein serine/threonine phosphatase 2C C-terminal domain-containing protein n=1 Tax=Oryzias latipes TaxID=8090 RepID=A0A3P9KYS2_ORYLA
MNIFALLAQEAVCDFIISCGPPFMWFCNEIVDTCLYKGSRDNMSVVLICFPGAPKVSQEAVMREMELDKFLEARVEGGGFQPFSGHGPV